LWSSPIIIISRSTTNEPIYVIDPKPIKDYYYAKYGNINLGQIEVNLPNRLFPVTQILDVEKLEWLPCSGNSVQPVSSVKRSTLPKSALDYIKKNKSLNAKIENQVNKILSEDMVIRSESNITVSKFVNQRSFEVSNNLTLRWLKSIDRHILNKYNNEYSEDSYFITTILNSLNASCGDTLLMLSVRRAIGFCKVLLITT